jgi:anti-sigma B factor antagonist
MSSTIGEPAFQPVMTETAPGGLRVMVRGEVDIASVGAVVAELRAAEAGDAASIVLDLSGVSFLDSMGISAVVRGALRSRADGDRLRVVTSPAVDRVIDLCGLHGRLPLA